MSTYQFEHNNSIILMVFCNLELCGLTRLLCNVNNPWCLSSSLDAVRVIHSEVLYVAFEQGRSGGW